MANPLEQMVVTQPYGKPNPRYKAKFHTGADLRAKVGSKLFAIADSKVQAILNDESYGLVTVLEYIVDGITYFDWYCHTSKQDLAVGQIIKEGTLIGLSGNTGNSDAPHLHLETRVAPNRYGNVVAHPILSKTIAGYVHPQAPKDKFPTGIKKVIASVKPQTTATKIVNLRELLAGQADDISLVQSALNIKVTGKWDTATTTAYKKWQESLGFKGKDADGKPGKTSLARLGTKYGFTVV